MAEDCTLSFLDILHNPEPLPSVKKNTNSKCGISLSIIFLISYIAYEIYIMCNYKNDYKVTYSQDLQQSFTNTNGTVTFALGLSHNLNSKNFNGSFKLILYNATNREIDDRLIKKCDPVSWLNKKGKSFINYTCLIDYPVVGGNFGTQIFHAYIGYEGEIKETKGEVDLFLQFLEPRLKHNEDNPFDYSEINSLLFSYDVNKFTAYKKYIKFIHYKTNGLFTADEKNSAYIFEFEEIPKIQDIKDIGDIKLIGDFRFFLSKKRDVYERVYVNWLDYFIDKICGKFISMKGFFELITLILVNPVDNLRIFTSLNKKKPSLFKDTSNVISDYYYEKNNIKPNDNNKITIKKDFDFCDKVNVFFKCCRKDKKRELIAINDFIEDKLTISNTLEKSIVNNIKYNKIRDIVFSIKIPDEFRDTDNREYEYLEAQLKNNFPDYEAEEIKIMVKEIINEKNKDKIIHIGEMK